MTTDLFGGFDVPATMFDAVDDIGDNDFMRDRYGRPLILTDAGRIPYTRVSTVASWAANQEGLAYWKTLTTALSIAHAPDIAAVIAGMSYDSETNRTLKKFVDEARARDGWTVAANWGTAVHLFTPSGEGNGQLVYLPAEIKEDVEGYDRELERTGLEVVDTEVRVVCDRLKIAGTTDHLYRCPEGSVFRRPIDDALIDLSGKVIVGDKKTGKPRPLNFAAQLGGYANSFRYNPKTDERSLLHPDLEPRVGVSAHIPLGEGKSGFGYIDLEAGFMMMAAACLLHAQRDGRHLIRPVPDRPMTPDEKFVELEAARDLTKGD